MINDLKEIQKQAENKIVPKYSEDYFLYLAKLVSEKYHQGQVDKAGVDYFKGHIEYVVLGVYSKKEKTVAYLHDIVEDTEITITDLNELEFPSDIVEAVELLTRIKNIDYQDYLDKIKCNKLAKSVKISDLKHNSDLKRLKNVTKYDKKRQDKYLKAIEFLKSKD